MEDKTVRIQITLSKEVWKRLKLWGAFHGKAPTTFAAQIVSSRVEANIDTINQLVDEVANLSGIAREEVVKSWLADNTLD